MESIFTQYLKYIVFFHTAPSPPEEGKPLPRPELATENAGSYNEGKRHEKFVPLPSLLFPSHAKTIAFSWSKNSWKCHCLYTSLSITLHHPVHHSPMPSCVSPFSAEQTHLILVPSQPELWRDKSPFHLCHAIQCPHLYILLLVEAVKISCGPYLPFPRLIYRTYLHFYIDTGVLTSPEDEVPRFPVSSAPPSQRNITLSQRAPQRPPRPFSTSKTFTTSHIPSTTKGNGAMQISDSFFPSSCSKFRPLFCS